jgi:hypothetical protein
LMHEEIGTAAGVIWHALEACGEVSLSSLKKEVDIASPVFEWAIGWLAREHKIVLGKDKRSWLVRLEGYSSNGMASRAVPSSKIASASA